MVQSCRDLRNPYNSTPDRKRHRRSRYGACGPLRSGWFQNVSTSLRSKTGTTTLGRSQTATRRSMPTLNSGSHRASGQRRLGVGGRCSGYRREPVGRGRHPPKALIPPDSRAREPGAPPSQEHGNLQPWAWAACATYYHRPICSSHFSYIGRSLTPCTTPLRT